MEAEIVIVNSARHGHSIYVPDSPEEVLFRILSLPEMESEHLLIKLLEAGSDVNSQLKGLSFLTAACTLGRVDIVRILLNRRNMVMQNISQAGKNTKNNYVKVNFYDEYGDTPLLAAAKQGSVDICRLLVENGAIINQPCQLSHQTPLHVAIEHSHLEVVKFLLEKDADPQLADNVGITPLYAALKVKNNQAEYVKRLIQSGCDVNIGSQDHAPIFLATRKNLLPCVKLLCETGCCKDIANKYGVTPVYEAAMKGHTEVLSYLLDQGCSPNRVDMYGQSPLHVATLYGHTEAVRLLTQAGANLKLRNQSGMSVMNFAIESGRSDILEILFEHGLEYSKAMGKKSFSSLSFVLERGFISTFEVLVRGCPSLHLPKNRDAKNLLSGNLYLLKLVLLSGFISFPHWLLMSEFQPVEKEIVCWLETYKRNPRTLKQLSRISIRHSLMDKVLNSVQFLPLPNKLKAYIKMTDL
ncbi:hypothetical protein CHS0354_008648 [Potamilus streckersoni]|uniref:SOCS box domain-containing protein n=1 Tax=Potamilus streckersoni TaxID=2493646 RepID=A0AAE0TH83_9BIVA|nr:hypothetical protein CHS0354_008648 [Potamilus streckersoni]